MHSPLQPPPAVPAASPVRRPAEAPLLDVGHLVRVARERWLGAVGLTLLACGLVGYGLLSKPRVYEGTATLMVERSGDRVVNIQQVVDSGLEGGNSDAMLLTHIEQLRGPSFRARMAESFSPAERREFLAPFLEDGTADLTEEAERATIQGLLGGLLRAERSGRTLLISVTVRHRTPAVAAWAANRSAEQYIRHLMDRATLSNDSALVFLQEQTEEQREKLEALEADLQAYREKHNLVAIGDTENAASLRVQALNQSLTTARVARLAQEANLAQAEEIVREGLDPRPLAALPDFAPFARAQERLDELESERTVLGERYGRLHPRMQENARTREAVERLRADQLAASLGNLRNALGQARERERKLVEELAQAEQESLAQDQLATGLVTRRRAAEQAREAFDLLLRRLNETNITSQIQNTNVRVVDRSVVPDRPVEPNPKKILLVLVLLAGAILTGYPLVADLLDNRVKSFQDVETYLGATLLGEIGRVRSTAGGNPPEVVFGDVVDEGAVEAFRGLYSQLQISSKLPLPKTLLVTSTTPQEGKSFIASNLAATFAAHGKRTLIVDGDLRRPVQHRTFGRDNARGLLTWIEAGARLGDDVLAEPTLGIETLAPHLHLLRTGGVSRRVTELLDGAELPRLFEALQRRFDLILIDTPPAGVFPDAEAFVRVADEMIYIVRFDRTPRAQARQVLTRIAKTNVPLVGIVLNAMPSGRRGSYYYSGYAYYSSKYYKDYERDTKPPAAPSPARS